MSWTRSSSPPEMCSRLREISSCTYYFRLSLRECLSVLDEGSVDDRFSASDSKVSFGDV